MEPQVQEVEDQKKKGQYRTTYNSSLQEMISLRNLFQLQMIFQSFHPLLNQTRLSSKIKQGFKNKKIQQRICGEKVKLFRCTTARLYLKRLIRVQINKLNRLQREFAILLNKNVVIRFLQKSRKFLITSLTKILTTLLKQNSLLKSTKQM